MPLELFLSPKGNDEHRGTRKEPLATLAAARDRIRHARQQGALPEDGAVVQLAGGVYHVEQTFELAEHDGGTASAPIVYRNIEGQTPRLLGGRIVSGFAKLTDRDVMARLPEVARPHVMQLDLKAAGLNDFGTLRSRGFSRGTPPAHLELFFDGQPMTLARWPNSGEWTTIADVPEGARTKDAHGSPQGRLDGGFHYDGDRPKHWRPASDIWVHGYWMYDWANSYEHVAILDKDQRYIKTSEPYGLYGFREGQRFYFLNVLEELDEPGEYYVDRQAGLLYFWPPEPLGDQEVMLSELETPVINIKGGSHVSLQGLTLECTRGHGVVVEGGEGVIIAGCTIRHTGSYAVRFEGGRAHGVKSCDIYDNGDGGVSITGGDRATLTPGHHLVENCRFHHQARWSRCYHPSVIVAGVGHTVRHCLMHDHPHCALLFTGNEHMFEFNEIHHTCFETGDVGAIYTGRDWTFHGNIIRHNYLHDVFGPGALGSMTVYLDDCVSGITVVGNIFERMQLATFIGGGRDCVVENNIYVDCDPAVRIDGRGVSEAQVWQNMVNKTMRERLEAMNHHQPPYSERYPSLQEIDQYLESGKGVPAENNRVARNIFVRCTEGVRVDWGAKREDQQIGENWADADAGFRDPKDPGAASYVMNANAKPLAGGFEPIPIEQIGLKLDEYRREV